MARGKVGKEEWSARDRAEEGEKECELSDWEGQPIRNLRSIKLGWEVRTRLSFIDASLLLLLPRFVFFYF